jgi:hypothetical protein
LNFDVNSNLYLVRRFHTMEKWRYRNARPISGVTFKRI